VQWRCLEGGSKMLIDAMVAQLKTKPSYGHQVTAVKLVYKKLSESFPNLPGRYQFPLMKVSIAGKGDEYFAHVISTSTFANLSTIDTERVPMTYKQRQAIRTLNYGPAVKVGIRFKTRWWEQDGLTQRGGSSYTDRPSRTIVYPSAGLGEAGPGVLMATYNWCVLSCSTFAYSEPIACFNLAGIKTLTASVPSSRNPTGPSSSTQIVNALGPKKSSSTSSTQTLARSTVCQSRNSGRTRWTTMHSTGTTTRSPRVPMRTSPLGNSVPSLMISCCPPHIPLRG
jgi:hypothetical protein